MGGMCWYFWYFGYLCLSWLIIPLSFVDLCLMLVFFGGFALLDVFVSLPFLVGGGTQGPVLFFVCLCVCVFSVGFREGEGLVKPRLHRAVCICTVAE